MIPAFLHRIQQARSLQQRLPPSPPGPPPIQIPEIPRPSDLPPETQSLSIPHPSSHIPPNTRTALIISNPDRQEFMEIQQSDLGKRVTIMKGKIENLKANLTSQTSPTAGLEVVAGTSSSVSDGTPPTVNVEAMQAQIRMFTEEVSLLPTQELSPWIRNPTREPPPDYTSDRQDDEWSSRSANI